MRMVLTTQRKSELLNADQSLKIFTRVIIVGESSSSIIHEEKKNTYESLISLSSHFGSLLTSTKDNCHDVTIIVRPQQYNNLIYDNKSHDTPSSSSASSSPIDGGKSSSSSKKTNSNSSTGNSRTKRKRYSTNSGGSNGAGESSGETNHDETTSTALAVPSTPTTTTFYAHRSILSVSLNIFHRYFSIEKTK
jgi:hypothetical protein